MQPLSVLEMLISNELLMVISVDVRNQKRFFPGDTYQPEDLAPLPEARRWRRVEQIENEDFFARRGIDIKAQYKVHERSFQ